MKHSVSATLMAGLLLAVAGAAMVRGQQAAVDTVLMNGKIITVDDQFRIGILGRLRIGWNNLLVGSLR